MLFDKAGTTKSFLNHEGRKRTKQYKVVKDLTG